MSQPGDWSVESDDHYIDGVSEEEAWGDFLSILRSSGGVVRILCKSVVVAKFEGFDRLRRLEQAKANGCTHVVEFIPHQTERVGILRRI